ncbi:toxin ETX/toxin MTX2 [Sinobacterium caligoides]|uniref:Toxin ETX/toxin MTX2 n=1 Tax=Sinobacterium caligoides TaxID=933926 RepID=A0A3N2DK58_9GAMM|nr:DUF4332 domain-containing protein [Sinobacterium caligoides]ROS00193.1 toxin ETX/toxin MTX2 [Sinobacterium caligoides]
MPEEINILDNFSQPIKTDLIRHRPKRTIKKFDQPLVVSDELTLYSGDSFILKDFKGCYLEHRPDYNYRADSEIPKEEGLFTIEVLDSEHFYLFASDSTYCHPDHYFGYGWTFLSTIGLPYEGEIKHKFTFKTEANNKVSLHCAGHSVKSMEGSIVFLKYDPLPEDGEYTHFTLEKAATVSKEIISDLEFDLDALTTSVQPFSIGQQELVNKTSIDQEMEFTVNKTIETSKSVEWSDTFTASMSTTFTAGVPFIAENETTITAEMSFTKGGSESSSDSQSFTARFPVTAPPHTTVIADAIVRLGVCDVPYVATVSRYVTDYDGHTTSYSYKVEGVYNGTNAFNLECVLTEYPHTQAIKSVTPDQAKQLEAEGIFVLSQLLTKGSTRKGRQDIAQKTGICEKLILTWVNTADLTRIKGINPELANLLELIGIDSVPELAQRNLDNLYISLTEVNDNRALINELPLFEDVQAWVDLAKELPKIVTH